MTGNGNVGTLSPRKEVVKTFTVTPPAQVEVGTRFKLDATLTSKKDGSGTSSARVQGTAPVRGTLEPLEEIADFRAWTVRNKTQQLDALIESLLNIPSGGTRSVKVNLTNHGTRVQSGTAKLNVPAGFSVAEQQLPYSGLQPGATTSVTFTVTNTDTSLPTANRAPDNGAYRVQIETSYVGGSATEPGAFNLVPTTTIPKAATAPTVDGHGHDHEYTGEVIDISTRWEGTAAPASDISGTAQLTHTDDALYAIFNITDDVLGTVLPPEDCKRPRRNDNIEFGIDPRGNSANTSTVFNMALFPATKDPANGNPPCFARERDNHQGGPETAPGVEIASVVTSNPYTGYRIEVKIPFSVLPDTIDPSRMGLNILVNDSDTQDLSSQTRVGWSTWSGVRADPWRWGNALLPGLPAQAVGAEGSDHARHRGAERGLAADPAAVGLGRGGAGWLRQAGGQHREDQEGHPHRQQGLGAAPGEEGRHRPGLRLGRQPGRGADPGQPAEGRHARPAAERVAPGRHLAARLVRERRRHHRSGEEAVLTGR